MLIRRIIVTIGRREIACSSVRRIYPSSNSCRKTRSFGSNSSSEDPTEFRGPGGLTARQIFQKVQDSADRDAKYANKMIDELEEEYMYASHIANNDGVQNPKVMSVKELKQVLDANSIDHSDYFEKSDLFQLVQDITNK